MRFLHSNTIGQLTVQEHGGVSEKKELPICAGIRDELFLEGLVGSLMSGYGGMSVPGGTKYMIKL